jgi:hypothetical protein
MLLLLLAFLPVDALRAEWLRAETPHFVVHAQGTPAEVSVYAAEIESLHRLLTTVTGAKEAAQGRKLDIFILDDVAAVRQLVEMPPSARAFYASGNFGDMAVVGRRDSEISPKLPAWRWALFHEYSHYFLNRYVSARDPLWFDEGFASVFETMETLAPDRVRFGALPESRWQALTPVRRLPVQILLSHTPDTSDAASNAQYYAEGWLLAHHYLFGGSRSGEIGAYLRKVEAGEALPALDTLFTGGVAGLEADLAAYRAGKFPSREVAIPAVAPADIRIEPLRPGLAELIPLRIRETKVNGFEDLDQIYAAVLPIARKYPDDADVATVAAWIAYAAHDYDTARRLIAPLMAAGAGDPHLLALQGRLITREALDGAEAEEFDPILRRARAFIERALKSAPNDPVVLQAMFANYDAELGETPAVAYDYLERALANAPADDDLRFELADALIKKRDYARAIATLRPLANAPHPSQAQAKAKAYIEQLQTRSRAG